MTVAGRHRRPPVWLLVPAGIATLLLAMPLVALLVRLDWANVPSAITSPAALQGAKRFTNIAYTYSRQLQSCPN